MCGLKPQQIFPVFDQSKLSPRGSKRVLWIGIVKNSHCLFETQCSVTSNYFNMCLVFNMNLIVAMIYLKVYNGTSCNEITCS